MAIIFYLAHMCPCDAQVIMRYLILRNHIAIKCLCNRDPLPITMYSWFTGRKKFLYNMEFILSLMGASYPRKQQLIHTLFDACHYHHQSQHS